MFKNCGIVIVQEQGKQRDFVEVNLINPKKTAEGVWQGRWIMYTNSKEVGYRPRRDVYHRYPAPIRNINSGCSRKRRTPSISAKWRTLWAEVSSTERSCPIPKLPLHVCGRRFHRKGSFRCMTPTKKRQMFLCPRSYLRKAKRQHGLGSISVDSTCSEHRLAEKKVPAMGTLITQNEKEKNVERTRSRSVTEGGNTMKRAILIMLAVGLTMISDQIAAGQFPLRIPTIPKIEKPAETTRTDPSANGGSVSNPSSRKSRDSTYGDIRRDATPRLVKDSVYVQAETTKEYWKAPGQKGYHSWAPKVRFDLFYNHQRAI